MVLELETTDLDVLERFARLAGTGSIRPRPPRKVHYKPSWRWRICRRVEVVRVLREFEPWFGERRRAKVAQALQRCNP